MILRKLLCNLDIILSKYRKKFCENFVRILKVLNCVIGNNFTGGAVEVGCNRTISGNCKARYTLFANNDETRTKWQNMDVRQIVYSMCSPCFANGFFSLRCSQDLRRGVSLFDEHKGVFCQKKKIRPLAVYCSLVFVWFLLRIL